ncbi:MAG TPA: FliM/FliN family flagellar motor C-terminal domain-containing protein, partial [Pirellulaceae bacterium]|nr:FliM/FliN family flagellar motor C-terminal domain-containing protein [Pirellulaceae bacterium]
MSSAQIEESHKGVNEPQGNTTSPGAGVEVQSPEYQPLHDAPAEGATHEINRFADIKVTVSGELGKAQISIERLMSLHQGSVLELDRAIDSPIELIAQGIPLARGEVVVVEGHFAVRVTEIYPRKRRG